MQSPSSIIQHIQSIENRFFCYLIVDNESQNDTRNQEKIQIFVNSIKSDESYARMHEQFQEMKSNRLTADHGRYFNGSEDERSQSSEHLNLTGRNERMANGQMNEDEYDEQENAIQVLGQMERTFNRDYRKLSAFFGKLKSKVNISSLDQSIINSQDQLTLVKRDENCETKGKELEFTRKLELDDEDLAYLLKQHSVPEDYRIKNIDVKLKLNLKLRAGQLSENNDDEIFDDFDELQDETSRQSITALDDEDSQQARSSFNGWSSYSARNSFVVKQESDDENS